MIHPPRPGQERATYVYDTVLGFGIKMASNAAQRFADFLVSIFKRTILPIMNGIAQRHCDTNGAFRHWWQSRQALGDWQAVLCTMFMYTDDPCILSVGPDMTHEVLKVWNWMSSEGSTMMAIPEKRCFGLSAKWIGLRFFTALGVCAVPAQKVLRACSQISEACSSALNKDQYRSLIGFLEHVHVRAALYLRGDKMYGLYGPLSLDLEPSQLVQCTPLMHNQLTRMTNRLVLQAGSSVNQLPAFLSGKPLQKVSKSIAARRFSL